MSPNKCPFSYATTKNMLISKEKVTMIQYLQLLNNHCQFLLYSSTDISSVLNEKQCQQSLCNKNMNSALFNPLTPLDGYIYASQVTLPDGYLLIEFHAFILRLCTEPGWLLRWQCAILSSQRCSSMPVKDDFH